VTSPLWPYILIISPYGIKVPYHALKVKEGMRGIALWTVNLNIGGIYVVNAPVTLSKRKYPKSRGRGGCVCSRGGLDASENRKIS
jgi:hypothetical protein